MTERMSSSKKAANKNILVLDDEQDVLQLLRIYLESIAWNVICAQSPLEALECLERTSFFLVLTDIAMPEMDGYEFINVVKEREIPSRIALMTGFGYNPNHTLVKINKEYKYPIFFKPFEFKKPKLRDVIQQEYEIYHKDLELPS